MWNSGLMGVNSDPINLSDEQKCGFRDFLKLHNYTDITVNYPSYANSLNFVDTLLYKRFENLDGRLSSKYFKHENIHVEHFWGNIPEIRFDDIKGIVPTGRIIGELFKPSHLYDIFKSTDGVQRYFSNQFDYYYKHAIILHVGKYDASNPQDRDNFRKNVIAFWSFAMTQGLTTRLVTDLYELLRGQDG